MPDALHHLLLPDAARVQAVAVCSYLVASSALSLAAGITVGWMWGRR